MLSRSRCCPCQVFIIQFLKFDFTVRAVGASACLLLFPMGTLGEALVFLPALSSHVWILSLDLRVTLWARP